MHIISGKYKNRAIDAPKGYATRPTSSQLRETLFNICQNYIEGTDFLDLFAGSGAMGFEALSRGAHSVSFIDSHYESIRTIKKNMDALGVKEQTHVYNGDVFPMLERFSSLNKSFDIIYADPPYQLETAFHGKVLPVSVWLLKKLDRSSILKTGGYVFIEDALKTLPEEYETLELVSSRRMGRSYLHQFRKKVLGNKE